jgi:hypothetical protein
MPFCGSADPFAPEHVLGTLCLAYAKQLGVTWRGPSSYRLDVCLRARALENSAFVPKHQTSVQPYMRRVEEDIANQCSPHRVGSCYTN